MRSLVRHAFAGLVAVAALAAAAAPAAGGTIDTTGAGTSTLGSSNYTTGGSFLADDYRLDSFSLILRDSTNSTVVAALVYATDGAGTPTGAPIWTGSTFTLTTTSTTYNFTPGVSITPGSYYFIGATSRPGVVAGTSGGTANWSYVFASTDVLASPAQRWITGTDAAPTTGDSTRDIRSVVVMNPEPGTWALFGLGTLALGGVLSRRRRSARRAPPRAAS